MILRSIILALGVYVGMTSLADARCGYGQANWPRHSKDAAQRLVRGSESVRLHLAYRRSRCLITAILHQNGADCVAGHGNNHVTVRVRDIRGAYHVFDYDRPGGNYYCTTH